MKHLYKWNTAVFVSLRSGTQPQKWFRPSVNSVDKQLPETPLVEYHYKSTGRMLIQTVYKKPGSILSLPHFLFFFVFAVAIFNYPTGKRQSWISRQSNFQDAVEAWIWAHRSRRASGRGKKGGIWLCWISSRCAVCQVRGLTDGNKKGRTGGVKEGEGYV